MDGLLEGSGGGNGGPVVYDLEAILLHKGGSATHGHYGEGAAAGGQRF
jgi:hypothetical protein